MPNHDPLVRLLHMRDYAKQTLEMASGKSREELDKNEMWLFKKSFLSGWSKMKHLVIECENILWKFEEELDAFLNKSEAGALK